jgi:hypothetical protein
VSFSTPVHERSFQDELVNHVIKGNKKRTTFVLGRKHVTAAARAPLRHDQRS